jgi:hypothetical protein
MTCVQTSTAHASIWQHNSMLPYCNYLDKCCNGVNIILPRCYSTILPFWFYQNTFVRCTVYQFSTICWFVPVGLTARSTVVGVFEGLSEGENGFYQSSCGVQYARRSCTQTIETPASTVSSVSFVVDTLVPFTFADLFGWPCPSDFDYNGSVDISYRSTAW